MKGYWRRFAASVTGFVHDYRFDPFFRTQVNIIALQTGFALFLLGVVALLATQLYQDALVAVSQGVSATMQPYSTPVSVSESIITVLDETRSRTIGSAAASLLIITALFTLIITRIALAPTRHALKSQKLFIENVAHELRTPLSIIRTNTEVRLLDTSQTKEILSVHKENMEEIDRMSDIINNLLSLSGSVGFERLEFRDIDLGAVVQQVIQKLRPLATSKRLTVEIRLSERRSVRGNATALEQIAMNIIRNAVSYTQEGRIVVIIEPVYPDYIELVVQDSGRGIARKDLFRIFEPFYRADASRKRDGSGSGLGLAIVSELVRLHNGKITVRSAEGHGTTVAVLLPAAPHVLGKVSTERETRNSASEVALDFSRGKNG